MKLAVIGTGHVGLVTCVALSTLNHEVMRAAGFSYHPTGRPAVTPDPRAGGA